MSKEKTYRLKHKKTQNSVYVCMARGAKRDKEGYKHYFVSPHIYMCGYGPRGRRSWFYSSRPLNAIRAELKILCRHPHRRNELKNLEVECYDKKTGEREKTYSMKRIIAELDREVLIEKLTNG